MAVPGDLEAHLNRDGPHSIAVEPRQFEAGGPFDVVLRNHGAALHVHLHLDDELSRQATLRTTNHYVDEGSVRRVRVIVNEPPEPVEGRLKVVTGYGAETAYVPVTLDKTRERRRRVRVDEALGRPARQDQPTPSLSATVGRPILAVGTVAVLASLAVVGMIGGTTAALGLFIVIVGIVVAITLLRG